MIGLCLFCVCVTVMAIFGNSKFQVASALSAEQLRDVLLLRQYEQQKLQRLRNSVDEALLNVLGESSTDLQIRLAERLLQIQENDESVLVYEQVRMPDPLMLDRTNTASASSTESVEILRLDVRGQVSDGRAFLKFFDDVDDAIEGWPTEMRACRIQKTVDERLDFHCVLDTYHWTVRGT